MVFGQIDVQEHPQQNDWLVEGITKQGMKEHFMSLDQCGNGGAIVARKQRELYVSYYRQEVRYAI